MSALLVVPLKKTFDVDFTVPLKNLISSSYTGNNANAVDHSEAISELNRLRTLALTTSTNQNECLEPICNYYDQLCALESKVPLHDLQIPFKWQDAFGKKIFRGRTSLASTSLSYEKACVLFNVAALQCSSAISQNISTTDGFKLAVHLFQKSAGIFSQLKTITQHDFLQERTIDLNPETLQVLSNLMLAQAQEIFLKKAIKHHLKELTVAQLAHSCQELYEGVLTELQKESLRSIREKDWMSTVAGKHAGFQAISQLYQSLICRNNKKYGEEIARLRNAMELFSVAHSRLDSNFFEEFVERAQHNLTESTKDNDFIYHDEIPDIKTLSAPPDGQLAHILPFTVPLSTNSKDLFGFLVSVVVCPAIEVSDARKSKIIQEEVMKLRESTDSLNKILAQLNLPAAIEATNGNELPHSLLEKAKNIRRKGGIESLRILINRLPELLKRNKCILDDSDRMLNDEAAADSRMHAQFKDKWSRISSEKLTNKLRYNINKYREIIQNAIAADMSIRETFALNTRGMELLSKTKSDLENECPVGNGDDLSNSRSAQKLRDLMNSIDKIKVERELIESQLKSAPIDLKDRFSKASGINGSNESLRNIFAPLCNRVSENIAQQNELTRQIQLENNRFLTEVGAKSEARSAFLTELATQYDCFATMQEKLKEGTKFYNDLTFLLVSFQTKVYDFCSAREAERLDLIRKINEESMITDDKFNSHLKIDAPNKSSDTEVIDFNKSAFECSLDETPMPQSFNPYATYTIKKWK